MVFHDNIENNLEVGDKNENENMLEKGFPMHSQYCQGLSLNKDLTL